MSVQLESRIAEVAAEVHSEVFAHWREGGTRIKATLVIDTVRDFASRVDCNVDELPICLRKLLATAFKVTNLSEEESIKLSQVITALNEIRSYATEA